MYLYTPNRAMLKEYTAAKEKDQSVKPVNGLSRAYTYAATVCRSNQTLMTAFMNSWEHTKFYSKIRRQYVPVCGVAFPASFFDEHIV